MKIINEGESDTRNVVMRSSNSEVSQIMKNSRWKRNAEKKQTERNKGHKSYSERVRAEWFCCAFKLGFLQLIFKASLILKSNLELALSIIVKEREL